MDCTELELKSLLSYLEDVETNPTKHDMSDDELTDLRMRVADLKAAQPRPQPQLQPQPLARVVPAQHSESSFETEAYEQPLIRRRVVQFDVDQVVLRDEKHGRDVRERKARQNQLLEESLPSSASSKEETKVGTVDRVDLLPLERENAALKRQIEQLKLERQSLISKLVGRTDASDQNFSVYLVESINSLPLCKRLEVNKALASSLAQNEASIRRNMQEAEAETRDKEEAKAEAEKLDKQIDELKKKRADAARRAGGRYTKVITDNE